MRAVLVPMGEFRFVSLAPGTVDIASPRTRLVTGAKKKILFPDGGREGYTEPCANRGMIPNPYAEVVIMR
jgi:hypothetical protein